MNDNSANSPPLPDRIVEQYLDHDDDEDDIDVADHSHDVIVGFYPKVAKKKKNNNDK